MNQPEVEESVVCENSSIEMNANKTNRITLIIIMAEGHPAIIKIWKLNLVVILRQLQMLPVVFYRL